MIIQGITLTNISVNDGSFNSNGALLYVDAGQSSSYSGGTSWNDLSGKGNNATLVGTPSTSTTYSGYLTFNGTSAQYANTSASKYNTSYTGKTVFVVARMTTNIAINTYRCLFGSTASGTRNFNTYIQNNAGNYQIHYSTVGGGGNSNTISLTAGQWFIAAVTQTLDGICNFYLNGQYISSVAGGGFSQWQTNSGEAIGQSDNYWYGDISLCAVYGRALSANEIQQNYNAISNRYDLDIVTNGLLANYDMTTYTSGSTVSDISGNGRTLTLYNTPTTTKVNNSTALVFNSASSQWAIDTAGYGTLLNTASGFTYDLWFYPITVNGTLITEYSNNTANSGWQDAQMGITSSGNLNTGVYNGSGAGLNPSISGPVITANKWYHCVLVYDGSTTITEYVNGVNAGSVTFSLTKLNPPGGTPYATYLSLAHTDSTGYYIGGVTGYFNGYIGAWKMYSRALSATEVSQNFQALRNRYGV